MKKGLVFGKFMPLHKGHLALIDFSLTLCDHLTVLICHTNKEPIDGRTREQWLNDVYKGNQKVQVRSFEYNDSILPNTSTSSKAVSKIWAETLRKLLPEIDIVVTSEPYGEYVAEYMNIRHYSFDEKRSIVPVSATLIRNFPFKYWDLISSAARPSFVKKICIIGTESTGKSTLTEKLAKHFNTAFVKEMARDIVEITDECTYEDLFKIAETHAKAINETQLIANKLLFVDTDLNITCSYSEFLFNRPLFVESWISQANNFDLYLFLEPDCEYIQDGTRLSLEERNKLSGHHKKFFQEKGIPFISIGGDWENRFITSCKIIEETFAPLS